MPQQRRRLTFSRLAGLLLVATLYCAKEEMSNAGS